MVAQIKFRMCSSMPDSLRLLSSSAFAVDQLLDLGLRLARKVVHVPAIQEVDMLLQQCDDNMLCQSVKLFLVSKPFGFELLETGCQLAHSWMLDSFSTGIEPFLTTRWSLLKSAAILLTDRKAFQVGVEVLDQHTVPHWGLLRHAPRMLAS